MERGAFKACGDNPLRFPRESAARPAPTEARVSGRSKSRSVQIGRAPSTNCEALPLRHRTNSVFVRKNRRTARDRTPGGSVSKNLRRRLLAEKSNCGDCRQKQPLRIQQCLNLRFEPHGHGSLRPSFSINSLNPPTMRSPRFTCVSDGNPLRRLLVRSKKGAVVLVDMICHTASLVALERQYQGT